MSSVIVVLPSARPCFLKALQLTAGPMRGCADELDTSSTLAKRELRMSMVKEHLSPGFAGATCCSETDKPGRGHVLCGGSEIFKLCGFGKPKISSDECEVRLGFMSHVSAQVASEARATGNLLLPGRERQELLLIKTWLVDPIEGALTCHGPRKPFRLEP